MIEEKMSKSEASTGSEGLRAKISKDEQIGYHKGSLNTLAAERNELFKIIQITESLIQAHIKELEKLGVKIEIPKK